MASFDALDHPEVAHHRAFELCGRGLVRGTSISGERLFEARELDNDGAFANAGVEGLDRGRRVPGTCRRRPGLQALRAWRIPPVRRDP